MNKLSLILFITGGVWAAVNTAVPDQLLLQQQQQPLQQQALIQPQPQLQQPEVLQPPPPPPQQPGSSFSDSLRNFGGDLKRGFVGTLNEVVADNRDLIKQRMVAGLTGRYFVPPPNPYAAGSYSGAQPFPLPYPHAHHNQVMQSYGNPPVNYSFGYQTPPGYYNQGYTQAYAPIQQQYGYHPSQSAVYTSPNDNVPCCEDYNTSHLGHTSGSYFPFNLFGSTCNSALQNQSSKSLLIAAALLALGFATLL